MILLELLHTLWWWKVVVQFRAPVQRGSSSYKELWFIQLWHMARKKDPANPPQMFHPTLKRTNYNDLLSKLGVIPANCHQWSRNSYGDATFISHESITVEADIYIRPWSRRSTVWSRQFSRELAVPRHNMKFKLYYFFISDQHTGIEAISLNPCWHEFTSRPLELF